MYMHVLSHASLSLPFTHSSSSTSHTEDDGLTGFFSCPPPPSDVAGVCSEDCSSSSDCDPGQKCCSNNCGHTCADPVPVPYLAPPLRCPAPETLPGICDLPTCEECADGFLCCENPCGGTMCAEGVSDPAPAKRCWIRARGIYSGPTTRGAVPTESSSRCSATRTAAGAWIPTLENRNRTWCWPRMWKCWSVQVGHL